MITSLGGLLLRRNHRQGREETSSDDGRGEYTRRGCEGRAGVEPVVVVGRGYRGYRETERRKLECADPAGHRKAFNPEAVSGADILYGEPNPAIDTIENNRRSERNVNPRTLAVVRLLGALRSRRARGWDQLRASPVPSAGCNRARWLTLIT